MKKFHYFGIMKFLILTFLIGFSRGTQASDFHSPRTAALGGAGHAGPMLNDAIYLNPSFASFLPTYSLGLNYLKYSGSNDNPHGRNYALTVQDGRNPLFQAGLGYQLREDGSWVHLGLSKTVAKRVGFGISAKYFFKEGGSASGHDLTFSTTGVITDTIQTSIVVDNLLQTDTGKARGLVREFILGTKFNVEKIVLVYVDPHIAPAVASSKHFGYETGLEFVFMTDFFLRVGMYKNSNVPSLSLRGNGYGTGLGWVGPRMSFDYGLERTVDPVVSTAHVFGATLYF